MIIAKLYNQIPNEKLRNEYRYPDFLTIRLAKKIQEHRDGIVKAILAASNTNSLGSYARVCALGTVQAMYGSEPKGARFISLNSVNHWSGFNRTIRSNGARAPLAAVYFYNHGELRIYLFGRKRLRVPIEIVLPFDQKPRLSKQREYTALALFFGLMKVFPTVDVKSKSFYHIGNKLLALY